MGEMMVLSQCSLQAGAQKFAATAFGVGIGYCDGPLGQINVSVTPFQGSNQYYLISLDPVSLAKQPTLAQVLLANSSGTSYLSLSNSLTLEDGAVVIAGTPLPSSVGEVYSVLVIMPPGGNPDIAQSQSEANICSLPGQNNMGPLPPPLP